MIIVVVIIIIKSCNNNINLNSNSNVMNIGNYTRTTNIDNIAVLESSITC